MMRSILFCMTSLWLCSLATAAVPEAKNTAATTLDGLLQQVKDLQRKESDHDLAREQRFLAARNDQQRLLDEAQALLDATQAKTDQLKQQFENNEQQIIELTEQLQQSTGALGEMFGVVRQSAGDLKAILESSLVSAQFPQRAVTLDKLANSKALPSVDELESFWYSLQQEMTESGKVVQFPAQVVQTNGNSQQQQVVRIGTFTAVANGQYLNFLPEKQQLMQLARQPGQPYQSLAKDFGGNSTPQAMAIDPTRGAILSLIVQAPTLWERVQQGGMIGYIILLLGGLGLVIALLRFVYLLQTGQRINKQLQNPQHINDNNPLGRILRVFAQNRNLDTDTLELHLDEAILRETPAISRGVRLLKLLAAIAPLLGLLGTVTGMIGTFQAITLFGTGDPKLMAGGISQALVTTMLGLIVAVPLLFMHAGIAARSQLFIQILDEQSAGLIARQMEPDRR